MQAPHDKLFDFTFRHPIHAAGWVRSVLPRPLAEAIDWPSLTPLRERFPDARLRPHVADSGFAVRTHLRSTPRDVLLLVEHKSYPDPDVEMQLLRYSIHLQRALQRRRGEPPSVVPILLRHGTATPTRPPEGATPVDAASAWLRQTTPHQHVFVDDLDQVEESQLAARRLTPLAELTLRCLRTLRRCSPDEAIAAFSRWQPMMRSVDATDGPPDAPPMGPDAIDAIGWYALATTDIDPRQLSDTFARILHRPEHTIMSTLERTYQRGLSVGKAEGKAMGKAEGKAEGKADALLRQLARRFGAVPDAVAGRVLRATPADLDNWLDLILDARELDELFGPSDRR